jgi:LysR family hydrogen peroxide-inducible transcriptional activator
MVRFVQVFQKGPKEPKPGGKAKMEVNQLRFLVAVAKTGSFSKAATQCYVSQPALSEQIQKLENEIGKTLLNRNRRNAIPTPAGQILVEQAMRILQQVETAKQAVRSSDGGMCGKISLGVLPTIAPYLLPHVFAQFSEKCPQAEVMVHEDMTARILQMMDTGELDLGILSLPIKEPGFEIEELFTEELLLAVPSKHPLATKPTIRIEDLYSAKFILMREGHCLGDQALVFCHRHDFRPHIVFRSSQIETIQSFVMAGQGVSLIPEMAKATGRLPLVYRSLEKPRPSRTIVAAWRSKQESNGAFNQFLKHLRQVAKTHSVAQ